jgi:hypothetical protein
MARGLNSVSDRRHCAIYSRHAVPLQLQKINGGTSSCLQLVNCLGIAINFVALQWQWPKNH